MAMAEPSVADPGMRFIAWEECARICKGEVRPDLRILWFEWASNDHHVVRRFRTSTALPNLREVHACIFRFSDGPRQLFDVLRASHGYFEKLTFTTAADHAGLRQVRFEIVAGLDGAARVRYEKLSAAVREDDVADLARGYGLWRTDASGVCEGGPVVDEFLKNDDERSIR